MAKQGKVNGLLDQALLKQGVLDAFGDMKVAVKIAMMGGNGEAMMSLSAWGKKCIAEGHSVLMCMEVVNGMAIADVAIKQNVRADKVLNNLVSCLVIYRAVTQARKKLLTSTALRP
ncbi:MAG: hypothetical protein ACAH80_18680 [Alphaproteobacteria bacterium]